MKIRRLKKDYAVSCLDVTILKWALKNGYKELLSACNKCHLNKRNKYSREHEGRILFKNTKLWKRMITFRQ